MSRRLALASIAVLLAAPSAARALPPVRSMVELRGQGVVQQRFDLSCGAAALATLLTYDLGDRVEEREIIDALLRGADADRIRERGGFSLLDLKRYAAGRGYATAGYKGIDLVTLQALGAAIVPIENPIGAHFVVFRGVVRGRAVLADPAYGNRTLPLERFQELWSPRVAFVVRRPAPGGRPARQPEPALVPPTLVRRAIGGAP